mgnify:CR=1 FL=1
MEPAGLRRTTSITALLRIAVQGSQSSSYCRMVLAMVVRKRESFTALPITNSKAPVAKVSDRMCLEKTKWSRRLATKVIT